MGIEFWHHWVYNDVWGPVWPNIVASVLWAAPALLHLHRKINRNHEELMNRAVQSQESRRVR